jgi:adenine specific DNA methylase Mod
LLATRGRNTPELTKRNGKMYAKLVAGTENDKTRYHEIIETENTQENAEKHHMEMRYVL